MAVGKVRRSIASALPDRMTPRVILVAISGGQDSVSLLHGMSEAYRDRGWAVVAGHVDHGLSTGSDQDAEAVRALCSRLGVTCLTRSVNVPKNRRAGESLEMAARRLRLLALCEMKREAGASLVALGHTADDQAETVLMRTLRGTGLAGLGAMAVLDGDRLRPLLNVWRHETSAYCAAFSLPVILDPSNADPAILRNRVRNEVIPFLEAPFPAARRALHQLATSAARDRDFLERAALEALGMVRREGQIEPSLWNALPPSVGYHALRLDSVGEDGYPQSARAIEALAHELRCLAEERSDAPLAPAGAAAIPLFRTSTAEGPAALRVPGRTDLEGLTFSASRLRVDDALRARVATASRWDAYLVADRAAELVVDRWHPGDRMHMLGSAGTRKLQDIFVDRRIPSDDRGRVALIKASDRIVWIPGVAIAEHSRVGPATTSVIHLAVRVETSGP